MEPNSDNVPQSHPHFVGGDVFVRLGEVKTNAATEKSVSNNYIRENVKRPIVRFQHMPEFMKIKGNENPIILVGGGPSLKKPEIMAELKEMASKYPVLAAGSCHDFLVENGIIPTYAMVVDPDPIVCNYMTNPQKETKYLIASQCHPKVFDELSDYQVVMWHCAGGDEEPVLKEVEPYWVGVGGGCTIGLRAINMAILLGYNNVHLFGYDSCLSDEQTHAYELSSEEEKLGLIGESAQIHRIRLGFTTDELAQKEYLCYGYMLAQLHHFKLMYEGYHTYFTPTFHGGGLLAHALEIMNNVLGKKKDNK